MRSTLVVTIFAVVGTLFPHLTVGADDASSRLAQALADVDALEGDFTQRQHDQNGRLLQESSGRFRLLRPGYFYWDIQSPDSQLVVADLDFLWHYDRDLETATRRSVNSQSDFSPLQILGGNEHVFRDRFVVDDWGDSGFELTTEQSNAGFKRVRIGFKDGQLRSMEILDDLEQKIFITFSSLQQSTQLSPQDFAFTPPPGVDVFFHDQ